MDEVIEDAPWVVTQEFLDAHDIHYVAHDALPYSDASGQANDVYDFVSLPAPRHAPHSAQIRQRLVGAGGGGDVFVHVHVLVILLGNTRNSLISLHHAAPPMAWHVSP